MLSVELHPLADRELSEVALYYEEKALGLGEDFLLEFERTLSFLLAFPTSTRLLSNGSRRVSLRRFPFHLIYRSDSDRLFVLAIAHHRRRPGYWSTRQG